MKRRLTAVLVGLLIGLFIPRYELRKWVCHKPRYELSGRCHPPRKRRSYKLMDQKLASLVFSYNEELSNVRKMKHRRPYLLAMLMSDIVKGELDVRQLDEVESSLVSLGHYSEHDDSLVDALRKVAEGVPVDDEDAEPEVLEEIRHGG